MKPPLDLLSEAHGFVLGHKERRQIMDSHGGTKLTRDFPGRAVKIPHPCTCIHTRAHTHTLSLSLSLSVSLTHTHTHTHTVDKLHKHQTGLGDRVERKKVGGGGTGMRVWRSGYV